MRRIAARENSLSRNDDEHLFREIPDSIPEVERYFETDGAEAEEALRALDRADLAMEELGERLCELRAELAAIVAPGF